MMMARMFRDEDTNDASSSCGFVIRKECPEGLNRDGIAEAPEAAMSSGSVSCLGLCCQ